jgi:hypothetical protein
MLMRQLELPGYHARSVVGFVSAKMWSFLLIDESFGASVEGILFLRHGRSG